MSINLSVPSQANSQELKPRITVVGVGGAGGNAVNNMIESSLEGVDFVVANTDAQALGLSRADRRIQLGLSTTQGLGSGSRPEVGRAAAEEAMDEVLEHLKGSHMAFIAAGMGGGTGTGGAPVIAKAARELGVLTVGVVTKPFQFEGVHRMRLAEAGIEELEQFVDTLIVIPNQNLFRVANEKTTFADAFNMADEVLHSGVRGVTDLMVMPGLINLDFADIRSVMSEMGKAMMGTGESDGERRALDAAEAAISNPLLDDISMKGAKGMLINITGGADMTLFEVDEAANRVRDEVDPEAYIIFGSTFDESLEGRIRVSVVATGINVEAGALPRPRLLNVVDRPQPEHIVVPEADMEEDLEPVAEFEPEVAENTIVDIRPSMRLTEEVEEMESEPEPEIGEPAAEMPSAMPSITAEDAFIPPVPADPKNGEVTQEPDPFAAAAMVNGVNDQQAKVEVKKPTAVSPSLFERITGVGRAGAAPKEAPAPQRAEPLINSAGSDAPTSQVPTADPNLDLPEQPQTTREEDELLDIPAFLRRQAN
ncbi:MAG: cell division protein FtsZ [Rhodospirillaceae bacterium]|jgi:cell division protein FtsZ|nr:cell division protein FtsZ [Rhodospirillaceae bacterium]MBT8005276.1 cell division protein FtsZ [Rhodospirillales bacterium]MBT4703762.1 cell division protein FtsZ [Rhodospirillaceae bacterium]MBT5036617.1 cell division protein FtsZ [Rhodospirillaceae bacterium]MBT6221305.1 cell division protein FtsZ [Rhodospirillaceae bacterium]